MARPLTWMLRRWAIAALILVGATLLVAGCGGSARRSVSAVTPTATGFAAAQCEIQAGGFAAVIIFTGGPAISLCKHAVSDSSESGGPLDNFVEIWAASPNLPGIAWERASSPITEPLICRGLTAGSRVTAAGSTNYQIEDTLSDGVTQYGYSVGALLCQAIVTDP